ncbi:restriction endonuclease subunit S [Edwardsiella tarda]
MVFEIGTLADYIKVQGGFAYKSQDFQSSGTNKVLKIKNVRFGTVDYSDTVFISDKLAQDTLAWSTNEGDLLISMTGSGPNAPQSLVGRVARVWAGEDTAWINQRVGRIVVKEQGLIHPDFIFYLLRQQSSQDFLVANSSGSANQANISGKTIEMLPCPLVSHEESSRIASILLSLDKKITLNRQINQTLEQMAQALFKSWFVDFDPVVDNALDAGFFEQNSDLPEALLCRAEQRNAVRQRPDFTPLPAETRQLFPAAFEACDEPSLGLGGWVPKGWKTKTLGEITIELRRGISPKYTDEDGVLVINQKCIRNHELSFDIARKHNSALKNIAGRELNIGDVLVNSTGVGTLGRIAQVTYLQGATVVDSHVTVVRVNDTECPIYTFGQLMLSMEASIERLGEGSTGQTELNRKVLSEQYVVLPPLKLTQEIERTFQSIAEKQSSARNECINLSKLRDTLLPKLISGELRLKDNDPAVGADNND